MTLFCQLFSTHISVSTGTDLTNDLLRFAVAETLSIGRAASDGVSLCLELVNHFVDRLLGRSPAHRLEISRQTLECRLDPSDAGPRVL